VASNWDINTIPNGDFIAQIPGTGTAPNQPILFAPVSIDGLILASTASLSISNNQALTVNTANTGGTSAITNNGTLALGSAGNNTDLALAGANGTVNLTGSGVVQLSNNAANRIYASNSGMTLNNSSTIQGSGQIGTVGVAFSSINNSGTIKANQSTALTLGGPITNTGTLTATNGGNLVLSGNNISGGVISAVDAGSVVSVNSASITGANLIASGGGQFNATGTGSLAGTIGLNGAFNIGNNSAYALTAVFGNMTMNFGSAGALNLNSTGNNTDLALAGISGTVNINGPVNLSNSAANRIYANATGMTLNNTGTIQGAGQIFTVGQQATFNNGGTITANGSAGMTLGGPVTNTGLIQAISGSSLTITGGTVNNTGHTIQTVGPGTTLQLVNETITNSGGQVTVDGAGSSGQLNSSTIIGGTVGATNGASWRTTGGTSNFSGGTLTLNSVLNVGNNSVLQLNAPSNGTFTLNFGAGAAINLNSTGNNTDLALIGSNGTVNLNGPVTLSNSAANRIYANSTGMTLNNNSTIQGSGTIGVAGVGLTSLNNNASGVITANQSNSLTLGGPITNNGLMQATNGANLILSGSNVANANGQIAAMGTGSQVTLGSATINGGTFTGTGGGSFNNSGSSTFTGTIALNGPLNIGNNTLLNLNTAGGPVTLNFGSGGAINMNSLGNNTDISLSGANGVVNLNGMVDLSVNPANRIYASSVGMTLNTSGTIQGAGQLFSVGVGGTTINNSGTINANSSGGMTLGGAVNNTGLIEATNFGTLNLSGGSVNNTGHTIQTVGIGTNLQMTNETITNTSGLIAIDGGGSTGQLNNATINGGTLQATNGAVFQTTGGSSSLGGGAIALNGILNMGNNTLLQLNTTPGGSFSLNIGTSGGVNMNSTGNNTDLSLFGANGTVNLNGPVTLSNNATNRIYASSGGMTLNNNSTIQGAGTIGNVGVALTSLNNNAGSTINANQSAGLMLGGPILNNGLLEATNGATLTLNGNNIANSGGQISAIGAGSAVQVNSVTFNGGTLTGTGGGVFNNAGSSTFTGTINLNGPFNVANNTVLNLNTASGPVTLNIGGSLNVVSTGNNTDLSLNGANGVVNLNGSGSVALSNNANNRIYANNAGMTLNNNSTIQGAGQIGEVGTGFHLINGGTIEANQSNKLSIGPSVVLTNNGTLFVSGGSLLQLDNTAGNFTNYASNTLTGGSYFMNNGTFQFVNADIAHNNAVIILSGASSRIQDQNGLDGLRNFSDNQSSGFLVIENGRNFASSGAFTNEGDLEIGPGDTFTVGGSGVLTQTSGTSDVEGTLVLQSATIDGGELTGNGTVQGNVTNTNSGVVQPGDFTAPGTLTIQGNYIQLSNGALDLRFAGPAAGQFDVLNITGSATLGGTLNLSALAGVTFFAGETFDVVNFASSSGTFSTVNGLNLGSGLTFQIQYQPTDVLLVVNGSSGSSAPEPGTWVLIALGCLGIILSRARRSKRISSSN
jgi:hypothetical protein